MALASVDRSQTVDHLPSWSATIRNSAATLLLGYGAVWGMRRLGLDPVVLKGIHLSSAAKGTAWVGTAVGVSVVSFRRYRAAANRKPAPVVHQKSLEKQRRKQRHKVNRRASLRTVKAGVHMEMAALVKSAVEGEGRQAREDEKTFQRLVVELMGEYVNRVGDKEMLETITRYSKHFMQLVTVLKPKLDQKFFRETRAELFSNTAIYFDAALAVIAEVEKDSNVPVDQRDWEVLRSLQQNLKDGKSVGAAYVSPALQFDEVPPKFKSEVIKAIQPHIAKLKMGEKATKASVSAMLKNLDPLLSSSAGSSDGEAFKSEEHWSFQGAVQLICDVINDDDIPPAQYIDEVRRRLPVDLPREKERQRLGELIIERLEMIIGDNESLAAIRPLAPLIAKHMSKGVQDMADNLLKPSMIDTYFYQIVSSLTSDSKGEAPELAEGDFLNVEEKKAVQDVVGTSLARLMKSSWGSAALAGDRWYIPSWVTNKLHATIDRLVERGLNNVLYKDGDDQLIKFDDINSSLKDFITDLKGKSDLKAQEDERQRRLEVTKKYLTERAPSYSDIRYLGDKFGFRDGIKELRRVLKAYPLVWRNLVLMAVEDAIDHIQPPPEEEVVAN